MPFAPAITYGILALFAAMVPAALAQESGRAPTDGSVAPDVAAAVAAQIQLPRPPDGGGGAGSPPPGDVIETMTLEDVLDLAKQIGVADPKITESGNDKTVSGQIEGLSAELLPWECENGACSVVLFYVYFGKQDSVDAKFMNSYNINYVMKMMKNDEDELVLTTALQLYGGVRRQHAKELGELFVKQVPVAIGYKPK